MANSKARKKRREQEITNDFIKLSEEQNSPRARSNSANSDSKELSPPSAASPRSVSPSNDPVAIPADALKGVAAAVGVSAAEVVAMPAVELPAKAEETSKQKAIVDFFNSMTSGMTKTQKVACGIVGGAVITSAAIQIGVPALPIIVAGATVTGLVYGTVKAGKLAYTVISPKVVAGSKAASELAKATGNGIKTYSKAAWDKVSAGFSAATKKFVDGLNSALDKVRSSTNKAIESAKESKLGHSTIKAYNRVADKAKGEDYTSQKAKQSKLKGEKLLTALKKLDTAQTSKDAIKTQVAQIINVADKMPSLFKDNIMKNYLSVIKAWDRGSTKQRAALKDDELFNMAIDDITKTLKSNSIPLDPKAFDIRLADDKKSAQATAKAAKFAAQTAAKETKSASAAIAKLSKAFDELPKHAKFTSSPNVPSYEVEDAKEALDMFSKTVKGLVEWSKGNKSSANLTQVLETIGIIDHYLKEEYPDVHSKINASTSWKLPTVSMPALPKSLGSWGKAVKDSSKVEAPTTPKGDKKDSDRGR